MPLLRETPFWEQMFSNPGHFDIQWFRFVDSREYGLYCSACEGSHARSGYHTEIHQDGNQSHDKWSPRPRRHNPEMRRFGKSIIISQLPGLVSFIRANKFVCKHRKWAEAIWTSQRSLSKDRHKKINKFISCCNKHRLPHWFILKMAQFGEN